MAKEYKNALGFTTTKEKYEAEQKAKKKAKKDEQAFYQKRDGIKRKKLEKKSKPKRKSFDDGAKLVTKKLKQKEKETAQSAMRSGKAYTPTVPFDRSAGYGISSTNKNLTKYTGKVYSGASPRKPDKIGI